MPDIVLTDEQQEAVTWIVHRVTAGDPVVALRGLAGTGKTTIIPALQQALKDAGIGTALGAATHRAKMVLRRKGMRDAETYHQHAMTPHFTGDYAVAVEWLGEECPCFAADREQARPYADHEIPPLIVEQLAKLPALERRTPDRLKADWPRHRATSILRSIGIDGTKYISGWGPKDGVGCLIIDEASMLNADDLQTCTEAFDHVVLVGDPGQLPPVSGEAVLHTVEGFELTQIQRQAKDSPIIQLAYAAREGQEFWKQLPLTAGAIERWQGVEAAEFLTSPLLVGKNSTRISCTTAIRAALGYPDYRPVVGEPIVCRMNDKKYKGGAFYNNALFRVVAADESDHRKVTLRVEDSDDEHEITIHLEEIHGSNIALGAIQCRFGYVYTAHTAQGGEWPTVYISDPGLLEWRNALRYMKALDQFPKWSYTALTRAKTMVVFVQYHDFTATKRLTIGDTMPRMQRTDIDMKPPSAPLLNADQNEPADIPDPAVPPGTISAAEEAIFGPEPTLADIPNGLDEARQPLPAPRMSQEASNETAPVSAPPPTVPPLPDALLPLAHGFCQYLQAQFGEKLNDVALGMTKEVSATVDSMVQYVRGVLQCNEHAEIQLSDALLKMQEKGLTIHGSPYELTLQVLSPEGFPVTLTLRETTSKAMMEKLAGLSGYLAQKGYTGQSHATY